MAEIARLENFSYAWPGSGDWILRELSIEFPQGQCHWLSGASGSGKTTLALALKELLPPGRQEGRLLLPVVPGEARSAVGLVLQNPETQILTESVGAEVAFGLENLCLPPAQMPARVRAALDAVGLELPVDHPTRPAVHGAEVPASHRRPAGVAAGPADSRRTGRAARWRRGWRAWRRSSPA